MHFKGQIYNSFHNNANIFEKNETEQTHIRTIKMRGTLAASLSFNSFNYLDLKIVFELL